VTHLTTESNADPFLVSSTSTTPLIYACQYLPDTKPALMLLLELHAKHHSDPRAQQVLDTEDERGLTPLLQLLRFTGAEKCADFGTSVAGSNVLADVPIFSQAEAVDAVIRLIDDCGASVRAPGSCTGALRAQHSALAFAMKYGSPLRLCRAIMESPAFDASCLSPVLVAGDLHKTYRPGSWIFSRLGRELQNLLRHLEESPPPLGPSGISVHFFNDWFSREEFRQFADVAELRDVVLQTASETVFDIIEASSADVFRAVQRRYSDVIVHALALAASYDLVHLANKLIDAVRSRDGENGVLRFVNSSFAMDRVALHYVGTPEMARVLLAAGADLHKQDANGETAAVALTRGKLFSEERRSFGSDYLSVKYGTPSSEREPGKNKFQTELDTLLELVDAGASLGNSIASKRVLKRICRSGTSDLDSVERLLQAGVSPTLAPVRLDSEGNTLLHLAVLGADNARGEGSVKLLSLLLFSSTPGCGMAARFPPNLTNYAGESPEQLLEKGQNASAMSLMRRQFERLSLVSTESLGREPAMNHSVLQFDEDPDERLDLFIQQAPSYHPGKARGRIGRAGALLQAEPWKLGPSLLDTAAPYAAEVLQADGEEELLELAAAAEEEVERLKQRVRSAQRVSAAAHSAVFAKRLAEFDEGKLEVPEHIASKFSADTPADVVQIHALWHVWQDNKLPKNEFKRRPRIQPAGRVDIWILLEGRRMQMRGLGMVTASDLYRILTEGDAGQGRGAIALELDELETAAYLLAAIRINFGKCKAMF
jgi:hypothetical protein